MGGKKGYKVQNREKILSKHKKNVPKFSKMCPRNGLKWCNLVEIGGYVNDKLIVSHDYNIKLQKISLFISASDHIGPT